MNAIQMAVVTIALVFLLGVGNKAHAQVVLGFPQQQDIISVYFYNGQSEAAFRERIKTSATMRMRTMMQVVDLNETQAAKVQLALRGDMLRLFREFDTLREETKDLNMQNQKDMQEAWQIIQPMYQRVQSGTIFGENSLMERVLREVLNDEQEEILEKFEYEQRQAKYEALVRITIVELQKQLPLLSKQRAELMEAAFALGPPSKDSNQMQAYVGYIALARLPKKQIAEILDEAQRKAFNKTIEQYARFGGVEWE